MATKSKRVKHTKPKSLSHGRPPTVKPVVRSISSKATRKLIQTHHTLEKRKAKAISDGDEVTASAIAHEINLQGGIEAYQRASLIGQRNDRGGDSSKILMEWLDSVVPLLKEQALRGGPLKMLEVGALSITNACSKSRLFEMERIDLNSQAEGIKQQDFMERPLPNDSSDQFDVISLSLVLNFVPDAIGKGNMLRRTLKFLKEPNESDGLGKSFPSLFLVLPAPCVLNSRYMDENKLEAIMESLGYTRTEKRLSNKLIYYLWRKGSSVEKQARGFKKVEIRTGKDRNNFAIVLK